MQFTYVLPGWESSTHDNRVLRDTLSRKKSLKVPQGTYYLCDAGYMNCAGFLTPFKARNVIERSFVLLNMRWGILRNTTWYSRKTIGRIILACALLHNFIRSNMALDPMEHLLGDDIEDLEGNNIEVMEWTGFRNNLANEMYEAHLQTRHS
ncbi:uncharacterized protein LOC141680542 [Apium graveolens]|uniref:uncharacterized protein LOC141680542 n=1 Tax=Apium graveolens TaxID=4045 RepID=UPI003D78D355